jgi:salicylate hydroxylase
VRVVVVGAGIGGLALAQALRRGGIEVSVHDRDPDLASTGGYRLHLDARATAALRRGLPPALLQAVLASSAGAAAFRRFAFVDHRMRVLAAEPRDPEDDTLLIGRVPLRRLLAHGLGDALRLGAEFTHHEVHADATVTAHFADGSTDRGDLLVGADGVGSRVTAALAGRPTSRPLGVCGLAGRTPLTDAGRALLPDAVRAGPALAIGPGGTGLFVSVHDPAGGTLVDPAVCTAVPADVEGADLVWGLVVAADRLPPGARHLDAATQQRLAVDLLDGWDPGVRTLVGAPATGVGVFAFHAADPDADLTPWPSGVVTGAGVAGSAALDAARGGTAHPAPRAGRSGRRGDDAPPRHRPPWRGEQRLT